MFSSHSFTLLRGTFPSKAAVGHPQGISSVSSVKKYQLSLVIRMNSNNLLSGVYFFSCSIVYKTLICVLYYVPLNCMDLTIY